MPDNDVKPAGLPTAMRVAVGIVAAGLTLTVIGLLVFPSLLFPADRPTGEPVVATESSAQVLAKRLQVSMTDQEIFDEVATQKGSTVVEIRRTPAMTTVLVSIPASVVQPTTRACYEFTLREGDITYETSTACPDVPSR